MKYSLDLASQVLRQTPSILEALLSELSEEWTDHSEGPGAWTPYQVVGHLTFIEESDWIDRTRLILEHGPNRVFESIDREAGFERFKGVSLPDLPVIYRSVPSGIDISQGQVRHRVGSRLAQCSDRSRSECADFLTTR